MTVPRLLGSLLIASGVGLSGCSKFNFIPAALFPLCPEIAEASYPEGKGTGQVINLYVKEQAREREILVTPLSAYVAELHGSNVDLAWFTANYPQMLCAFDPRQVVLDRETYLSCIKHAPEWISIVRSQHPENLMLTQTKFRENCSALRPS